MTTFDVTNPLTPTIDKDPDATLDYSFDWTAWLGADQISTFVITVPSSLTLASSSRNGAVVTAFISGGKRGDKYAVACKITTIGARTDERTMYLRMVQR